MTYFKTHMSDDTMQLVKVGGMSVMSCMELIRNKLVSKTAGSAGGALGAESRETRAAELTGCNAFFIYRSPPLLHLRLPANPCIIPSAGRAAWRAFETYLGPEKTTMSGGIRQEDFFGFLRDRYQLDFGAAAVALPSHILRFACGPTAARSNGGRALLQTRT
eukprot:SAG22_NODE_334_length_12094_cov_9.446019_7_plen_162_part_00